MTSVSLHLIFLALIYLTLPRGSYAKLDDSSPLFNFTGYKHVHDPKHMVRLSNAREANLAVGGVEEYRGSNEDPRVCHSLHSDDLDNGTSLFVCPHLPSGADSHCCGHEDSQHCCNFWEDSGRVTVVAVGLCFVVGTVILIALCLIKKSTSRRQSKKEKDPTTQRINFNFSHRNNGGMEMINQSYA